MKNNKLTFIAGPCVIEDEKTTLAVASQLKDIFYDLGAKFIFKASFDKANRTSVNSFRGPGMEKGRDILGQVKNKLGLKILSDVHSPDQVDGLKDLLDVIQIPAFLCRQTDLILAAARTKKTVNVKKGQFLAPEDMQYIVAKIESTGNRRIMITERGSCFGYNNLVVDFRSFLIMKKFGYPVIFDVTHSLQRPSAACGISGGDSQFIEPMSLAGVACGIDGLFMEVHPDPKKALCDKHTSFELKKMKTFIKKVLKLYKALEA